jgi:hypothetical protein
MYSPKKRLPKPMEQFAQGKHELGYKIHCILVSAWRSAMTKNQRQLFFKVAISLAAFACSATALAQSKPTAPPKNADRVASEPRLRTNEPRDFGAGSIAKGGRPSQLEWPGAATQVPSKQKDPSTHPRKPNWRPKDKSADPKPLPTLKNIPSPLQWEQRYRRISHNIGRMSNKGFIPVTAVSSNVYDITDHAINKSAGKCAGWKGYGFIVPPGESISINLSHPNKPWFRMLICDKWGDPVPGALGSLHPQPPLSKLACSNQSREAAVIYVIVDDPGWMSTETSPYTLMIARSWNPDLFPEDLSKIVSGIWGHERNISAQFHKPMAMMPGFM